MILTLTVLNGPHLGHSATIQAGAPRTFGRGVGSDIVVQDQYLSDVHFALYCDSGGARVRASYAWQSSQDGSGAALVNSPRHLAKLNAVVPVAGGARLGGEMQCLSSRLTEHARTGGYCLANLTLASSRVVPNADLSLSVFNVTGKRYADPAGPAFVQEDVARDARTFHAKLVYQF